MRNVNQSSRKAAKAKRSAWRDTRGAVMVEYALLLTFVAVPTVVGLTAAGVNLLNGYIDIRDHLLWPTP